MEKKIAKKDPKEELKKLPPEPADVQTCATHNKIKSFKCVVLGCDQFLCPDCLKSHPHYTEEAKTPAEEKSRVFRADRSMHFLTYNENEHRNNKDSFEFLIWKIDIKAQKVEYKALKTNCFDYESIVIQNVLYLCGGVDSLYHGKPQIVRNHAFRYNYLNGEGGLVPLKDMNISAYAHNIITVDENYIYKVGGRNDGGYLDDCEKYDIANNTWTPLKPLSEKRGNVSLGVFNCRKIYAIGGYNITFKDSGIVPKGGYKKGGFINIIECLDTWHEDLGWKKIDFIDTLLPKHLEIGTVFNPRCGMAVVQNANPYNPELLIFGGCAEYGLTCDTFALNFVKNNLWLRTCRMKINAGFIQRKPTYFNRKWYLLEYGRILTIHEYDYLGKDESDIHGSIESLKFISTYDGGKLFNDKILQC